MAEQKGMSLTTKILLGLILGLLTGLVLNYFFYGGMKEDAVVWKNAFVGTWIVNGLFELGGGIFLNLLKMLVVPLVTFSLIVGVCGIGDIAALGRIGIKSFLLYLLTTAIAISTAIILALLVAPGKGLDIASDAQKFTGKKAPPITEVFINIIPSNPVKAFAEGEMLSIIFYAIMVGVALLIIGKVAKPIVQASELLNEVAMKLVDMVMSIAHIGVFCLIAKTFSEQGIDLLLPMASYFLTVLGALGIHFFITILVLLFVFTRFNPVTFMKKMFKAQAFAFSTASSGATIPVTLQSVTERLGVKNSVASFTVPLGATINMDGTAIMQGVATVFIANVYGVDLTIVQYVTVIGMAVLASIGTAGVPGVGLIMLAMVLNQVGLPVEGIGLIIGVDRLLDMCRTAVNITGDAMVSTVVAKGEGKINVDIYNDPDAGNLDFDEELDISDEDEEAFAKVIDEPLIKKDK